MLRPFHFLNLKRPRTTTCERVAPCDLSSTGPESPAGVSTTMALIFTDADDAVRLRKLLSGGDAMLRARIAWELDSMEWAFKQ